MDDIGIGIDIGASKIVVAVCRGGKSEVVLNGEGRRSTQFCVAFNNKERLFGDAAEGQYSVNPENTIYGRDAKQWIGMRKYDNERKMIPLKNALKMTGDYSYVKFDVDYKDRSKTQLFPEHIFTMFLRKIKNEMEIANKSKVSKAVITVPSMFNSFQRFAVKNAVLAAGIEVQAILNDSTATAITYAIDRHGRDEKNLLIFDMGASTTDVAVVSVSDGSVEVKACGGSLELGGDTFDLLLVTHFIGEFEREKQIRISDDKQKVTRLRMSCQKFKKMLSATSEANLYIESFHMGEPYQLKMTRTTFELICQDLFEKIEKVVNNVVVASKLEIHEVVVVGNGGRIPKVEAVISEYSKGKELSKVLNYDEAVAVGAAYFAARKVSGAGKIRRLDVSQTIAIPLHMEPGDVARLTIVKRGKLLPFELDTTYTDKKKSGVTFFQGECFLAYFSLSESTSDIIWNIDSNGLVNLTAQDTKETQKALVDHQKPNEPKIKEIQALEETFEKYELEYKKAMEIKNEVEKLCFGYRRQVKSDETKRFLNESDCKRITDICNETLDWLENPTLSGINELDEKLKTVQRECDFIIEKSKYTCEVQHANMLLDEKNYKAANSVLLHIFDTYGKHIDEETLFNLSKQRILALKGMEDYRECVKLLDNLLKILQDDYKIRRVRSARAHFHCKLRNYQQCIDDIEFVLRHEHSPELHLLRNEAILEMNLRIVDEMFTKADKSTKSKLVRGFHDSNWTLGQLVDTPEFKFLCDNGKDFTSKVYMMRARNHIKLFQYKQAIEACGHAAIDPDNHIEIWEIKAEAYLALGKLDEAEEDIASLATVEGFKKGRLNDLMRQLEGKRYDAIKRKHDQFKRDKQYQSALNILEQVEVDNLEKCHKLDYFCKQAFLLCELYKYDEGVEMCTKALSIDGRYTRAFELRAECYFYLEDKKKAYRDCETALRLGTTNSFRMREIQKHCEEATRKKGFFSWFRGNDTQEECTSNLEKEFNQLNDNNGASSSNDVPGYMKPTKSSENKQVTGNGENERSRQDKQDKMDES